MYAYQTYIRWYEFCVKLYISISFNIIGSKILYILKYPNNIKLGHLIYKICDMMVKFDMNIYT